MIGRMIDNAISVISPAWAVRRAAARATLDQIQKITGVGGGYSAGKVNRTNPTVVGRTTENRISRGQIGLLRDRSWDLYRNNPHARKIVRSLKSKVIGRGMSPQCLATDENGQADIGFRNRAKELWARVVQFLDVRGRPGFGGQTLHDLAKTALQAVILSGEALVQLRPVASSDVSPVAFSVQLVDAGRLDETKQADTIYYGIEFASDKRKSYHVRQTSVGSSASVMTETVEIPADKMLHLFLSDDIDQIRGTPWYAPCLEKTRDIGDYEYNELKAAAMAACVVLGYRRSSGQNSFGLTADDWDLTDGDGNKVTNISPGMLMDLGNSGEIQGFNPQRPNANAADFLNYQLRSVAAGMPGTKPSTVTGDYKQATFSSEKAADNDTWPEIEQLQDWFAASFYQPIYEEVIKQAVIQGYFDGIPGFNLEDFTARSANYLACNWSGPVQRSINPVDDVKAQAMKVWYGLSSPQRECGVSGSNWKEIQAETSEWIENAKELGLPVELIAAVTTPNPQLTMQVEPTTTQGAADASIAN